MRIANPIYDVVFKYLMDDTEIARQLIGMIIGEEIVELLLRPQEYATKIRKYDIVVFRLDFKATIKTKSGGYKNVLIELQKAKMYDDLARFRNYLGENYKKTDQTTSKSGKIEQRSLPITTIYFLGFDLPNINTSVLKIKRTYLDMIANKALNVKTDFVEKLTHDCFVILIPELPPKERTQLEGVLKVFNQSYKLSDDNKLLEISKKDFQNDKLTNMIVERLKKAATDRELLRKMEIEEEIENVLDKLVREKEEMKEALEVKDKALEKKDKAIDKALEEKDKALEEKDKALEEIAEKERIIADLMKKLNDKNE